MHHCLRFFTWILCAVVSMAWLVGTVPAHAAPIDESEPNDTQQSAQSLVNLGAENPVSARMNAANDIDWFRFEAVAGQKYVVETFNVAGSTHPGGRPLQLYVYDSNFTEVGKDAEYYIDRANGSGNTNSAVEINATTGGTYYIKINLYSGGGNGPYSLRVLPNYSLTQSSWNSNQEPNDWASIAFQIQVGRENALTTNIETRNSSYITARSDRDWFRFEAEQGKRYSIETFNVAGAIHPDKRPLQLFVYDSDFTEVAKDAQYYADRSNGTGNTNASVEFDATKGGTYYFYLHPYVSGVDMGSGPYSVRVLPHHSLAVASWDENHEPNNWASNAFALKVGSDQMIITNFEPRNGSYHTIRSDRDWFRFEANIGEQYVIETFNVAGAIHRDSRPLQLYVYDSDFTEVTKDAQYYVDRSNGSGNTNASVSFSATKGGTYYIYVHPYVSGTDLGSGTYNIRVLPQYSDPAANWNSVHEPNNWALNAAELQIGAIQAVSSTITQRDDSYLTIRPDTDWFRFEATQGQEYVVETFNVAGAINRNQRPMQLFVYDSDFTEVAKDATYYVSDSNGAGNTNASVGFVATKGGTYFIQLYPYNQEAGSGPYHIRILPHFSKPTANWNAALEPNNWRSHAAPLDRIPCGRQTTIEARNSSYLTTHPDRDWFRFDLIAGQEYSLELFDISARFQRYGLVLQLYDRELSKLHEVRDLDIRHIFTADYSGVYYAQVFPYENKDGTYRIRIVPTDGEPCDGRSLPQVQVEGCASIGINNETGEVTLRGTPRRGCAQIITRIVQCTDGATPQDVILTIGSNSFPMSRSGTNRYSVTIDTGSDLPTGNGPFAISVKHTCNLQSNTTVVGAVVLFDPSGLITDAENGEPIPNATVTLYQVPDAIPDQDGQTHDCRTLNTRGGNSWVNLPPSAVVAGESIDPITDAINNAVRIAPAVNPQVTGLDGSYAWDVIEGCWFITVEAPGYLPRVSPLVGIPPAVTDLDMQLQKAERSLYLPIVQR